MQAKATLSIEKSKKQNRRQFQKNDYIIVCMYILFMANKLVAMSRLILNDQHTKITTADMYTNFEDSKPKLYILFLLAKSKNSYIHRNQFKTNKNI